MDDLIDVIEGNRKYMKCLYVYNKIDVVGIDDVDKLARQPNSIVISCNLKAGFALFNFGLGTQHGNAVMQTWHKFHPNPMWA